MGILQEKAGSPTKTASPNAAVTSLINHLSETLWKLQEEDGHWHFALDDNVTMSAEFILFHRWIDLHDDVLIQKLAHGIRNRQKEDGSWDLFYGGPGNLSATIESYLALLVSGASKSDPALERARRFILKNGGIAKSRVFTKIWLSLFGLYPWSGVPMIPPEIMLAPRQIPFNLYEFSYWSRVTIVPLTILFHLQRSQKLTFDVDELYLHPSDKHQAEIVPPAPIDESWIVPNTRWDLPFVKWENIFVALNRGVSLYESKVPVKPLRRFAVQRAREWILSHQEESGDWGGIQPPMLNNIMALYALGMPLENPVIQKGLAALKRFTRGVSKSIRPHAHEHKDEAHLQSCVSPLWDTVLSALALLESGTPPQDERLQRAKEWIWNQRIRRRSDWGRKALIKPGVQTAAWCFQYHNSHYPDLDDTALATLVLYKLGMTKKELQPALHWIFAMQGSDGGFGTFDRDSNQIILNRIPFADLKSLIDPSNPDVTGHVLETLGEMGFTPESASVKRAIRYLKLTQRPDGSWFGRWGVNLLYGTSAALIGMRKVGEDLQSSTIQRGLRFLLSKQNTDGGWGESCDSYSMNLENQTAPSTPSQTAWALMALQSCFSDAKEVEEALIKGLQFLEARKSNDGLKEEEFTGTGFPQHFYLRYDGYRIYFPLIALGRIRATISSFLD